jgi:long-chain acyl-CoA synthetase
LTLGELIKSKAEEFGSNHLALIQPETDISFRALTYKDLNDRVNQLAHFLLEKGINKTDRAAILLRNSLEFIISYFAIAKIGAIAVPLNVMLTFEELDFIIQDAKASALITSASFKETSDELVARIDSLQFKLEIENFEKDCFQSGDVSEPNIECADNDIATLIYTSGTTGSPKGVMLTHDNLLSNARACLKRVRVTQKDRFSCLLLLYHSFTLTTCVLVPFYAGATSVVIKSLKNFKDVFRQIIKAKVTVLIAIPPIYRILSEAKTPFLLTAFPFSKLLNPIKACVSGGEALPLNIMRRFEKKFGIPLIEGYGLTEASPVVALSTVRKKKAGSVGRPLKKLGIKIVDDNGNEMPVGGIGEIIIKGPSVMKGYYDKPDETMAILKDGWLYSGDLGKLDEDGFLYIAGRKKDLIISKGLNIYPKEVEDALYTFAKIKEAAVVGKRLEDGDEIPVAYIVLKEGESAKEEEIHEYLKHLLAHYKIPRRMEFRKELPKTPTGKILKRFL